jgi:transposase-like protein
MRGKRRRHDPEFKVRLALEAINYMKGIQDVAREFDIGMNVASQSRARTREPF